MENTSDPIIEADQARGRNRPKKKEDDEIPSEINWEKVTMEQREKWKQMFKLKKENLQILMIDLQRMYAMSPLGRDRTFRRYWTFKSVPGLFIEKDENYVEEEYIEDKLVPQNCDIKSKMMENDIINNDKENDKRAENAKEMEPIMNDDVMGNGLDLDEHGDSKDSAMAIKERIDDSNNTLWSFYQDKEDIEKLIESLNPRGVREGPLKLAIMKNKNSIVTAVDTCPVSLLHQNTGRLNTKNVKVQNVKSRNKNTLGHVQNGSAKELMELSMREQLLDIEERIFVGTLGALKNVSRTFTGMLVRW